MQALILAGGSGTRFWPLSRKSRPKQLLALEGERTLLRDTLERLAPVIGPESVWVCTTEALADAVRRDLPEVPPEQILGEPEGRNTAPAIAWAVRSMPEDARRGVVAVLPADHRVGDPGGLPRRAGAGGAGGRAGGPDDDPRRGAALGRDRLRLSGAGGRERPADGTCGGCARFVEKPRPENAGRFLAGGNHLWNAGIFVFRGSTLLDVVARLEPELRARAGGDRRRAGPPARALRPPAGRIDRLRDHGEARRHRHPAARLRLERPRLLGGARRGPAAGRHGELQPRRRPWPSRPPATSCSPTRGRSPCWGSTTWSSCAPATRCWSAPARAPRRSASWSPSSPAAGAGTCCDPARHDRHRRGRPHPRHRRGAAAARRAGSRRPASAEPPGRSRSASARGATCCAAATRRRTAASSASRWRPSTMPCSPAGPAGRG